MVLVSAIAAAGAALASRTAGDDEVLSAVNARIAAVERTEALLDDKYRARSKETTARVRSLYKLVRAGWVPLWTNVEERGDVRVG